jgi:ribokinase
MIIKIDRIPKPGETVIGGEFSTAAGGKGANQAVAAARAGGEVSFVARVGDDMFGQQAVEGFVADGIDTSHVLRDSDAPSGVASIFVDERGENSIAVASGANARLTPEDVLSARDAITSADVLVTQLETPLDAVQAAVDLAAKHGVRVILMLTGIEVSNDAAALAAAEKLNAFGVEAILITLGSRGAFIFDSDHRELVPGFEVEAVDTTAAGDVFNGALAVALAEGSPLTEAVRFANAAAALAVTKLGAQPSAPTREEIQGFLRSRS